MSKTSRINNQRKRASKSNKQKQPESFSNAFVRKHLTELANLVGGLQFAQEAMLQALIQKGVLTPDDFNEAVKALNEKLNQAATEINQAKKGGEETPQAAAAAAAS